MLLYNTYVHPGQLLPTFINPLCIGNGMNSLPIVPSLFPNAYQMFAQRACNWIKEFQFIQLLHNPRRLGLFVNIQKEKMK